MSWPDTLTFRVPCAELVAARICFICCFSFFFLGWGNSPDFTEPPCSFTTEELQDKCFKLKLMGFIVKIWTESQQVDSTLFIQIGFFLSLVHIKNRFITFFWKRIDILCMPFKLASNSLYFEGFRHILQLRLWVLFLFLGGGLVYSSFQTTARWRGLDTDLLLVWVKGTSTCRCRGSACSCTAAHSL